MTESTGIINTGVFPAGVNRLINAAGTLTELGGTRMLPQAAQAMAESGASFVDLELLQKRAGEQIAGMLGVEAAFVASGAAAGLIQAAAACMAGKDPHLRDQLPGAVPKNEIVIMRSHRNPYDQALRLSGAKLVEIGNAIETGVWELEYAIRESTAAVVFFLQSEMLDSSLRLAETIQIAHQAGIPVIVDAAAELPPKSNLWSIAQAGADLVIFSGGKDIRGPQTSGLIVGRADLIEAVQYHSAPNDGVGRPMKTGKEIIIGLLTALRIYLEEDEQERFRVWERLAAEMQAALAGIQGIRVKRYDPSQPRVQPPVIPRLLLAVNPDFPLTAGDILRELRNGSPPIVLDRIRDGLIINFHTLTPEESKVVEARLVEVLHQV